MEITIEVPDKVGQELLEKYAKKDFKPWRAEERQSFWFVNKHGHPEYDIKENNNDDYYRYLTGNYYETRKKAEQSILIAKAKGRLNFRMLELNNGWTPDWEDDKNGKFFPCYDYKNKKWDTNTYRQRQESINYHFPSQKLVCQFMEEMKADLELVFNINQ